MKPVRTIAASIVFISGISMYVHCAAQAAPAGRMPVIKTETLSEREVTLPADLPGEKTLVLIAFERVQQKNIDTWVNGLKLKESALPWIETPVIDPQNAFFRALINGGMRGGIPDTAMREKTITLYTDRNAFIKAMALNSGVKSIYAAVVSRAGQVLTLAEGDYSAEKAEALLAALAVK
jgi:hypothetical protein